MTRAGVVAIAIASASAARADSLGVSSYRLANGLQVILAPDASLGAVAVRMSCGTGSRDDPPHKHGLASLVASLKDNGSTHVKAGAQRQAIDAVGGFNSASADADATAFTTEVPPNALALALYFEADRLAGFPDAVTIPAIDAQKWTVGFDGRLAPAIAERALRAGDDPLAPLDVDQLAVPDVVNWWRRECSPTNVTLAVAGVFDRDIATGLVEKYFGWIPARARSATAPRAAIAPLGETIDLEGRDIVQAPELHLVFRTDVASASSTADLEIAGRILGDGKSSRLYRRLVVTDHVATDVSATLVANPRGGAFTLKITLRNRDSIPAMRAAVFEELWRFRFYPIATNEIAAAKVSHDLDLFTALGSSFFRTEMLVAWSVGHDSLDAFRARIDRVSVASLQATAKRWLDDGAAVVMRVHGWGVP